MEESQGADFFDYASLMSQLMQNSGEVNIDSQSQGYYN